MGFKERKIRDNLDTAHGVAPWETICGRLITGGLGVHGDIDEDIGDPDGEGCRCRLPMWPFLLWVGHIWLGRYKGQP